MVGREATHAVVVKVVAKITLGQPQDIDLSQQLRGDLAIESIDLMDILYELEEHLGIRVGAGPLFLDPEFFEETSGAFQGDNLTEQGLTRLGVYPGLDPHQLAGPSARLYLGSVAALVDWAHGERMAVGRPPPSSGD